MGVAGRRGRSVGARGVGGVGGVGVGVGGVGVGGGGRGSPPWPRGASRPSRQMQHTRRQARTCGETLQPWDIKMGLGRVGATLSDITCA